MNLFLKVMPSVHSIQLRRLKLKDFFINIHILYFINLLPILIFADIFKGENKFSKPCSFKVVAEKGLRKIEEPGELYRESPFQIYFMIAVGGFLFYCNIQVIVKLRRKKK